MVFKIIRVGSNPAFLAFNLIILSPQLTNDQLPTNCFFFCKTQQFSSDVRSERDETSQLAGNTSPNEKLRYPHDRVVTPSASTTRAKLSTRAQSTNKRFLTKNLSNPYKPFKRLNFAPHPSRIKQLSLLSRPVTSAITLTNRISPNYWKKTAQTPFKYAVSALWTNLLSLCKPNPQNSTPSNLFFALALLFGLQLALTDKTPGEDFCSLNLHNFFCNSLVKKKIITFCPNPEPLQLEEGSGRGLKIDNYAPQTNLLVPQLKNFNNFYFYKNNVFAVKNFFAITNSSKISNPLKPLKHAKKRDPRGPSFSRVKLLLSNRVVASSLFTHKKSPRVVLHNRGSVRRAFKALRCALPCALNRSINAFAAILYQHAFTSLYKTSRASKRHLKKKLILDLFTPSARDFRNDAILRATRASLNFNLSTLRILPNISIIDSNHLESALPSALALLKTTGAFAPVFALSIATRFSQVQNFFENTYNLYERPRARLAPSRFAKNAQDAVVTEIVPLSDTGFKTAANGSFSFIYAINAFYQNVFDQNLPLGAPFALSNSAHFDKPFLSKNFDVKNPVRLLRRTPAADAAPLSPFFWAASRPELILLFAKKPFLLKFVYSRFSLKTAFHGDGLYGAYFKFFEKTFPFGRPTNLKLNNIFFEKNFLFFIKKNTIKSFAFFKLPLLAFSWHYLTIVKFLEFATGKKIYLKFYSLLSSDLEFSENARCLMWAYRLRSFKKTFGAKLFVVESLKIIYTALKCKDIYFLSDWLLKFFYKISFWKYKTIFRYLYYVLRYLFRPLFGSVGVRGVKFQLKGKVSVAGNARTRTVRNRVGDLSYATYNNKIILDLNLIRTFTGVIGFKTWLSF